MSYSLDDAYIHMAVAKQMVLHQNWGVTPYEFSSSTSSLLWPMLLIASYIVVGVNDWVSLLLNVVFATLVLVVAWRTTTLYALPDWQRALVVGFLAVLTPLPTLALTGMEHTLQLTLVVYFTYKSAIAFGDPMRLSRGHQATLIATAVALSMTRYESLLLVGPVAMLLALRGRVALGAAMLLAAVTPLLVYGVVSALAGSFLLPNSIMLKGKPPAVTTIGGWLDLVSFRAWRRLGTEPELALLVTSAVVLLGLPARMRTLHLTARRVALALFVFVAFAHAVEGSAEGRYVAYVHGLGILLVTSEILSRVWNYERRNLASTVFAWFAVFVLLLPSAKESVAEFAGAPRGAANIYEQQYQMARFVREYYSDQVVAANDIGAITFLADVRLLDVWGLASIDVARLRVANRWGIDEVQPLAHERGVLIAITYEDLLMGNGWCCRPRDWTEVGWWKIRNRVTAAQDTVYFYAVDRGHRDVLTTRLRAFSEKLPSTVEQGGLYTRP